MYSPTQIFFNARIYTLQGAFGAQTEGLVVSALAIQNGRILATGSSAEILDEFANLPGVQVEDMDGQIILPGLTDAHIHLMMYALGLQKVDCETQTRQECLERVAARARQTLPGKWVLGHGWNQNNWPEGFGFAADLDAIAPHNPVYLTAKSLHAGWANSAALQWAGINATTPDPQNGKIGRTPTGDPNGILYETAMGLVESRLPQPDAEEAVQAIKQAQPRLARMGITGVHDFDRRTCFAALQTLHARGELHLRVVKSLPAEDLPLAVGLGLRTGFGDDFLRIGSIKAFADGALGPHTAAMFSAYADEPGNKGMLTLDKEQLYELGRQAAESGLSMAVHAIGDRANHEVLDAYAQIHTYEQEHKLNGGALLRHRIEHVQVLHPADAARLAEMQVIASMQPIHATSDMLVADRCWGERSALAYAWKTQIQHGAHLAFGSDAPVESPNPFWGLHAAVTRQRQDGSPGEQGWYPEQCLALAEALRGFTSGAAYAAGMEERLGQLAPGYLADLIVLPSDPFHIPPEKLYQLAPTGTMVGGNWVWRSQ